MEDWIPFFTEDYWWLLGALLFSRSMDFLSTYIATPNLALEGNPIAKWLGWKLGGLVNFAVCVVFAAWPMVAIILVTTSLLIASKNFSVAWSMRAMGEAGYQYWYAEQLIRTSTSVYLFCLAGQTILVFIVGVLLVIFSTQMIPIGIGFGIIAYAVAVAAFTLLGVWRRRLTMRV